jgi:hypothetical protein
MEEAPFSKTAAPLSMRKQPCHWKKQSLPQRKNSPVLTEKEAPSSMRKQSCSPCEISPVLNEKAAPFSKIAVPFSKRKQPRSRKKQSRSQRESSPVPKHRSKFPILRPCHYSFLELPLEPHLARVLLAASDLGCLDEALTVTAMLSCEGVFTRRSSGDREGSLPDGDGLGDHVMLLQVRHCWCFNGEMFWEWFHTAEMPIEAGQLESVASGVNWPSGFAKSECVALFVTLGYVETKDVFS